MVKAVILDLDDTLYAYEPLNIVATERVREFTCKELGITAKQFDEAFEFGKCETKRQLGDVAASHNRILYCQKALEYLGVKPMPLSLRMYETYWGTILDKMRLRNGAREFLEQMHEQGITVMIGTNLTAHIQHRKIEALGITEDIAYLVTSEEVGEEKPAPALFNLCLKKLGLPAEEVCFIGDGPVKDVKGAQAVGMRAILFEPDKPSAEQFAAAAEEIIKRGERL